MFRSSEVRCDGKEVAARGGTATATGECRACLTGDGDSGASGDGTGAAAYRGTTVCKGAAGPAAEPAGEHISNAEGEGISSAESETSSPAEGEGTAASPGDGASGRVQSTSTPDGWDNARACCSCTASLSRPAGGTPTAAEWAESPFLSSPGRASNAHTCRTSINPLRSKQAGTMLIRAVPCNWCSSWPLRVKLTVPKSQSRLLEIVPVESVAIVGEEWSSADLAGMPALPGTQAGLLPNATTVWE